jgi:hexosaminidase
MSWRGTKGAVEAAKEGHEVILTPTSHCYFDYYQSDNENEPLAIGGFLPLEKVYNFNPIPEELTEEESHYVLGAQGNVWTEYMPTEKQVEYMAFPRMIALSEVVWSQPKNKNYKDFISRLESYQRRLESYQRRLDAWDINYANHIYEVKGELKNNDGKLSYDLTTVSDSYPIYYSIDGGYPNQVYSGPISIDTTMTVKAVVKNGEENLGNLFQQEINLHKGVGATITIDKEPHPSYNAGGKEALINGISGSDTRFGDKEWLGFWGEDITIKIERDPEVEVKRIRLRFFVSPGQWIYEPKRVWVYYPMRPEPPKEGDILMGGDFEHGAELLLLSRYNGKPTMEFVYDVDDRMFGMDDSPWIEIRVENYGIIPDGLQGAGNKAWTFIDEIIIE